LAWLNARSIESGPDILGARIIDVGCSLEHGLPIDEPIFFSYDITILMENVVTINN